MSQPSALILSTYPLSGADTKLLRECLLASGFYTGDYVIAHLGTERGLTIEQTKTRTVASPLGLERFETALRRHPSNVVITLGMSTHLLAGGDGRLGKWRGSVLVHSSGRKFIPVYSPGQIRKMWSWKHILEHDLRRARIEAEYPERRVPEYIFHTAPTFPEVMHFLARAESAGFFSSDIETVARHIACIGIGISETEAMCIPFMTTDSYYGEKGSYWTVAEEIQIIRRLIKLFRTIPFTGQNWNYDAQYLARYWGIAPQPQIDTMVAWHTCFPGEPKALDFLSSMLCNFHEYWKDERNDYRKYPADEKKFWEYNAKDCVITYECAKALPPIVESLGRTEQCAFQHRMLSHVMRPMLRGTRVDMALRSKYSLSLWDAQAAVETELREMTPPEWIKPKASPWYSSPIQLSRILYDVLGCPPQRAKKTGAYTTDDDALEKLKKLEPALARLFRRIQELRSIGIFKTNFVDAALDWDNRIRCSYSVAGTETFRLSSSQDAFGRGANLQTIPKGTE